VEKFREDDGKRYGVVPVRFVRACKRGHIGDIDWKHLCTGQERLAPVPCGLKSAEQAVIWMKSGLSVSAEKSV